MTKQTNRQGGPSGDYCSAEIKTDGRARNAYEDDGISKEKMKNDAARRILSKTRALKEKQQTIAKKSASDVEREKREKERKERERRDWEKHERSALEAERRERELEFERWEREEDRERERARKGRIPNSVSRYKPRKPPAGYKDPHDACKPVLTTKLKEEKRQEIKALMNCIAYHEESRSGGKDSSEKIKATTEEMDNSMSSDTTSDMTDVTPRSSSSGCSSMSKQSVNFEKTEASKNGSDRKTGECQLKRTKSKTETESNARNNSRKKSELNGKGDNQEIETDGNEDEIEEVKYLEDAFEDLDIDDQATDFASSIITGLSEERRAKCGRKNMTFTNEQLREIERVNLILLKKIMGQRKPRAKSQSQPPVNRKTSAAINRAKMEERIERENKILLKKLQSAKGTTGTLSRKMSQTQAYY